MKYFIDLGANDSCSARIWRKLYDPECEYKIYSFEPEESFKNRFEDIPNCVFLPMAAWTEDGVKTFFRDVRDKRRAGGTLSVAKVLSKIDRYVKTTIHTFDFSNWMMLNFSPNDEIVLKMDIEGSEYDVIPKMYNDGTLKWIDKLFIEYHWYKMKGFSMEKHNEVVQMVSQIPQEKWPGVENAVKILGKGY